MKNSVICHSVRLVLLAAILGAGFGFVSGSVAAGRIVVAHDDLILADGGFHEPSDPGIFAQNVAAWFTGGRAGRFLAYSDNQGLTGASLINGMASAGHTWVVSTASPLTLSNLMTFDGIFLCGHPVAADDLSAYVNAGGNVYLAGVGVADDDMPKWNSFLLHFGLGFTNQGTGVADFPISSAHPIFAGVDHLYGVNGTSVVDLQPSNPTNRVMIGSGGMGLFAVWEPNLQTEVFDAFAEFSSFQGGTSGAWFYQEFNGSTFTDMVFQPAGNSFSGFQPAWTAGSSVLPLLFWDSATPDGLVFHPGLPGEGPQPSRHDVALSWAALKSGFYSIRGFVRGDNRIGSGGNGFQFGVYREQDRLFQRDIEFNDKSRHPVFLRHVYVNAGERVSFRVFDKGNNEYDYGTFNFTVRAENTAPRIRVSQVELCWDAEPNVTYKVEYRSLLTTNAWLPFDTNCFMGDGSVKCVYDTVLPDDPQKFYRVVTNCVAQH